MRLGLRRKKVSPVRQRIESVLHDGSALERIERPLEAARERIERPLEAARERVERAVPLEAARQRIEHVLPERVHGMLPRRKQKKGKRRLFIALSLLAGLTALGYFAYKKLTATQQTSGGDWQHGPGRYDYNVGSSVATARPEPTPPLTEPRQPASQPSSAESGDGVSGTTPASASSAESGVNEPAVLEGREQEGLTWSRIRGLPVYDVDDNEVGKVEAAYNRGDEGAPEWIALTTRALNPRRVLVPLDDASIEGDRVCIPYPQDLVREAPAIEDDELTPEQESELYRHYNLRRIAEADAESLAIDTRPLRRLAGTSSSG